MEEGHKKREKIKFSRKRKTGIAAVASTKETTAKVVRKEEGAAEENI